MSNTNVGNVYQQVISDVVETSRVDFEEGGVDEAVLDELSKLWQNKLSSLGVAQFPWDPKIEATPATGTPSVPPNTGGYSQAASSTSASQQQSRTATPSQAPQPAQLANNNNNGNPAIKQEPGLENGVGMPQAPYPAVSGMTAEQRAAQHLQASYGDRASASIGAIRQQQQMQQQRPATGSQPNYNLASYQQALAQQAANNRAQIQGANGAGPSQTDGADEAEYESMGVVTRFGAGGEQSEMGRVEIDHMIRRKIEAMGQTMEGGGLMLPLKEQVRAGKGRGKARQRSARRQIIGSSGESASIDPSAGPPSSSSPSLSSSSSREVPRPIGQYDGLDDDDDDDKSNILKEEEDEDAINSELDDSDDAENEEDDDDSEIGQIMLCVYEKVQRVKSKWKSTMKDGVLTVNGREYVFHKATGEYEW